MSEIYNRCKEAADYINTKFNAEDAMGLVLGSGLGEMANEIENPIAVPYAEIPNFPVSTAPGHAGRLICGLLNGVKVLCMQGRFHFYEGYKLSEVTMYVRVMKLLKIKGLILTNAAGGVNETFKPGTLMVIDDFINFSGDNPLVGPNLDEFGLRFPDMTTVMTPAYRDIADEAAKQLNIELRHGVYMQFRGPSFETPAEIEMARIVGADAVGMSTVPEIIVARHCGLPVLAISCITNLAAGITGQELSLEEVEEAARNVYTDFKALLKNIVERI